MFATLHAAGAWYEIFRGFSSPPFIPGELKGGDIIDYPVSFS